MENEKEMVWRTETGLRFLCCIILLHLHPLWNIWIEESHCSRHHISNFRGGIGKQTISNRAWLAGLGVCICRSIASLLDHILASDAKHWFNVHVSIWLHEMQSDPCSGSGVGGEWARAGISLLSMTTAETHGFAWITVGTGELMLFQCRSRPVFLL